MHSIILTVHNKGWLIDKVIQGIKDNTVGEYELIVVVDGCTDNSDEVVRECVQGLRNLLPTSEHHTHILGFQKDANKLFLQNLFL